MLVVSATCSTAFEMASIVCESASVRSGIGGYVEYSQLTNCLRRTINARRIQLRFGTVFTVVCLGVVVALLAT